MRIVRVGRSKAASICRILLSLALPVALNTVASPSVSAGVSPTLEASRLPGLLDVGFDPGVGLDVPADQIIVLPDGKILIGGAFTKFNGTNVPPLVRLTSDGALDPTFDAGAALFTDGIVLSFAVQDDGRMVLAAVSSLSQGLFPQTPRVLRLNADGSLDPAFQTETPWGTALPVAVQKDGKVLFNAIHPLIRVLPDGTRDPSFTSPTIEIWQGLYTRQAFIRLSMSTGCGSSRMAKC